MIELEKLRQKIDRVDSKIAGLLKKRAAIVREIQQLKKVKGLPGIDAEREKEILSRLESDYEREIFRKILEESRKWGSISDNFPV